MKMNLRKQERKREGIYLEAGEVAGDFECWITPAKSKNNSIESNDGTKTTWILLEPIPTKSYNSKSFQSNMRISEMKNMNE